MSSNVEQQINKAITETQEFSAIKEVNKFDEQIAAGTEQAKQAAIQQADASVQFLTQQRDTLNEKIANPPMKDAPAGGKSGAMKQIVDNEELSKLQSELKLVDTQLAEAKSKAEAARQEADQASTQKAESAQAAEAAASQEAESLSKASSLRASLVADERADDDKDLNKMSENFDSTDVTSASTKTTVNQTTETTQASAETSSESGKIKETSASTGANTD